MRGTKQSVPRNKAKPPACAEGRQVGERSEPKAEGVGEASEHIYDGDFIASYPVVPGHEFAGEVVDVGPDVVDVQVGDKVVIDPSICCNRCKFCRENR